ncbi:exodeoxyribonuclease VII large subunit [Anaerotruncus sp. 80]|uniref:Exodeoxyribonuclease 7 large subunit n=1 Tax=Anaerotruncus colihominis TaxID=169435 RepID=A0A845QM53_9FIRM|nr:MULTISPECIES: exodeoxyribonuclease VII large subunit [Anaerotruncus]NBH61148.1 exodeoxyribonuclease VII large subunit [Anaerotruncus colihominis]NCF01803.1 exodeoxyribonuclease VII large subunit [Anaerotruncus sp. 80]
MALKPVTVSQLNEYISRVIGTDPLLGAVVVKGEISNLKYHGSGHVYFSIIDATSKINCFLPRDYAMSLHYPLEDGMEVTLTGSISVFKKNGTYSLYVKIVEVSGEGNLAIAFEKMKEKLSKEGLFDQSHKKPIPKYPNKIGIVTSATGAAVKDILKILKGRNHLVDVMIFPVLVQGEAASADIAAMLDYINETFDDIDTLIVGRGGGSADDLWAFNEENVARAIYRSEIPIISAVGHEIDFTIADLVADLRAETPTAAAQLVVPDTEQMRKQMEDLKEHLYIQLSNKLMYHRLLIDNLAKEMKNCLNGQIAKLENELTQSKLLLEENNPAQILENGYSVLTDEDGKVISAVSQLCEKKEYKITLQDGFAKCRITEIGGNQR